MTTQKLDRPICHRLDGARTTHASLAAARRAAARSSGPRTVVEIQTHARPHAHDACGWDELRMSSGCPGY